MRNRDELKQAKLDHKYALRKKDVYLAKRDDLVRQILNSQTPKWGSFKLHLVKW